MGAASRDVRPEAARSGCRQREPEKSMRGTSHRTLEPVSSMGAPRLSGQMGRGATFTQHISGPPFQGMKLSFSSCLCFRHEHWGRPGWPCAHKGRPSPRLVHSQASPGCTRLSSRPEAPPCVRLGFSVLPGAVISISVPPKASALKTDFKGRQHNLSSVDISFARWFSFLRASIPSW